MIEGFCFSASSLMICVDTDKGSKFISRDKFEKWADDRDKRLQGDGTLLEWDLYYAEYGDIDLYEFMVIQFGANLFDMIKKDIEECLN